MSETSREGIGKRKTEVMKRLEEIVDKYFGEEALEMLAGHDLAHYDYLTDGFELHCKSRIVPHIPGRNAQARA